MKNQLIKMQSENAALILFLSIISVILGAIMAILSHYPAPAYILASAACGLAAGGIISTRRESRFLASAFQSETDKLDEFTERYISPADTNYPREDPFAPPAVFHYPK